MEWPGLNFQLRSYSESEAEELLLDNEIAPNIIISGHMGGNIETVDVTKVVNEQKAIEKKTPAHNGIFCTDSTKIQAS